MTLFYRSNRQQTDLLTIRATLLEIKQRSSELEVVQQLVIKIRVNYDLKQSTFGSSSTIHYPLTEVRGKKNCSNGEQAKSVDRSGLLSPDKTKKQ